VIGATNLLCAAAFCSLFFVEDGYAGDVPCSVDLTASPTSVIYGNSFTTTATVIPSEGAAPPGKSNPVRAAGDGAITFTANKTITLGSSSVTPSGFNFVASISSGILNPGSYKLGAAYSGDSFIDKCSFVAGGSPVIVTVKKAGTTTDLTQGSSSSEEGDNVTFVISVNGLTGAVTKTAKPAKGIKNPSGKVTVYDNGKSIGTAPVSGGNATFSTTDLSIGNHTITASYPGDSRYNSSNSGGIKHKVTHKVADHITLLPNSAPSGQVGDSYSLKFHATGGNAPYTITLVSGSLPPGLSLGANGLVDGTPKVTGSYPIKVQAVDKNGVKDRTSVVIIVTNGKSRIVDPDLRALLDAERLSARRLGEAQINNILDHLASLHGHDCLASTANVTLDDKSVSLDNKQHDQACAEDYALWFTGNFVSGTRDQTNGLSSLDYGTTGFTAGFDKRVSDTLLLGASVGMGFDHTDIGTSGTNSDARALAVAAYGSWEATPDSYVDALIGYNNLKYNVDRFVSFNGRFAYLNRNAEQMFAALSLQHDFHFDPVTFSPYVRLKTTATRFGQGFESGAGNNYDLTYLRSSDVTTTASIGFDLDRKFETAHGIIRPFLGVEFQKELSGGAVQRAFLSSDPTRRIKLNLDTVPDNLFSVTLGSDFAMSPNSTLTFAYRGSSDFNIDWINAIYGQLDIRF
jgi:hypothetical protein